jgi:pSer/pThr/pTyr-binding forkhead associated (FHA) protein
VSGEGVFLRDLGSRNGTLVNGVRVIGEQHLQDGDHIQVGPLVLQLCLDRTAPPAQPPVPASLPPDVSTRDTLAGMAETGELPPLSPFELEDLEEQVKKHLEAVRGQDE